MIRAAAVLAILVSFSAAPGVAGEEAPKKEGLAPGLQALDEGNTLMGEGKYAEALAKYREARAALPEHANTLYNGGLAAYLSRDYDTALDFWKKLKELEPSGHRVRAKLIQAYAAKGLVKERDAERGELVRLRADTQDPKLRELAYYCCEQFEAVGRRVMVFEHFELVGEFGVKYVFIILNDEGKQDFRISLGSYDSTNALMQQMGDVAEGQRAYHLDGYYNGGRSHRTFGFYKSEPPYDRVRGEVVEILAGRKGALSGTDAPAEKKEKGEAPPPVR